VTAVKVHVTLARSLPGFVSFHPFDPPVFEDTLSSYNSYTMAHIRDTVSIQPDTVTLSGYDEIWSVTDIHRNPSKDLPGKLDAMTFNSNKPARQYVSRGLWCGNTS
jgi:hypothetical protein